MSVVGYIIGLETKLTTSRLGHMCSCSCFRTQTHIVRTVHSRTLSCDVNILRIDDHR